jgi:type I restriction enzyme M protein
MWRRVTLKNYRSIESAQVELAPFTVLVGPNGSGKTNFTDALVLARDIGIDAAAAVDRRGGIGAIRRWGIPDSEETHVTLELGATREQLGAEPLLQSFTLLPDAESGWRFGSEVLERRGEDGIFWQRGTDGTLRTRGFPGLSAPVVLPPTTSLMLYARQLLPVLDVVALRRLQLDLAKMRAPQPSGAAMQLMEDGGNLASVLRYLKVMAQPAFSRVLAAMKRLIPELEDIRVEEAGKYLTLEFQQRQAGGSARFDVSSMSDGALRALGILVAAEMTRQADTLIIEEPEISIHPGAAPVLFEVLKRTSERAAVLVTTHSPEFLDAARDEAILVCQYREGLTRLGPLAEAQREVVRDGLFSLSELMRSEPLRIEGEQPEVLDPRDGTP